MERDIRSEQHRDAISQAWKIWDVGKKNLDALHIRFNTAASHTQNPPKADDK